MILYTEEFARR